MTNEQALRRIIYEVDDLARYKGWWFAPRRRLARLRRTITFACHLAVQPDVGELCEALTKNGRILGWPS